MEAIRDLSWRPQMALGTLERFDFHGWQVTAVGMERGIQGQGTASSGGNRGQGPSSSLFSTQRYRLLFFSATGLEPVYAVNLECSILGNWIIGEQRGKDHHILEHLSGPLAYGVFKTRALDHALNRLIPGYDPEEKREKPSKISEKKLKESKGNADK